jgi:hypothetical protein
MCASKHTSKSFLQSVLQSIQAAQLPVLKFQQQFIRCWQVAAPMRPMSKVCMRLLAGEAPQREQLYHDIAAAQARLTAAQQRRTLAMKDLNRAEQELKRLRGLAKGSKATKQRLAEAAAAEAEWLARPGAAGTLAMVAGPLSKQVGRSRVCCYNACVCTPQPLAAAVLLEIACILFDNALAWQQ